MAVQPVSQPGTQGGARQGVKAIVAFFVTQALFIGLPLAIQYVANEHGYYWGLLGVVLNAIDQYIGANPNYNAKGLLPF